MSVSRTISLSAGLCLFLATFLSCAQSPPPSPEEGIKRERPVIGLVLSGGGARGLAHVGVIKVLEEMHIPVDVVVGTSAGSAVGALYAMGLQVSDIEDRFHTMDWERGFQDQSDRSVLSMRRKQESIMHSVDASLGFNAQGVVLKSALIQGQQLELILNEITAEAAQISHFDQFPRRYRAVAADLATGEEVVIDQGSLPRAIRASMSIPGVFPPIERDGRLLVDGGVANNLPVSVARALGADIIIAVDISEPLTPQGKLKDILSIAGQMTNFLTRRNVEQQLALLGPKDVLILPDLGAVTSADFFLSDEIVEMGATATRRKAVALQTLALSESKWRQYRETLPEVAFTEHPIHRIRIRNSGSLPNYLIRERIRQKTGQPLDREMLETDLNEIYGMGYFESVNYTLTQEQDKQVLVIQCAEKSWGPNYLLFDFAYEEDFDLDRRINLGGSINFTGLNDLGAESTTTLSIGSEPEFRTEFYQPLQRAKGVYLQANAGIQKRLFNYFEAGSLLTEAEIVDFSGSLAIGREFRNWADWRTGVHYSDTDVSGRVGVNAGEKVATQHAGFYTEFRFDTLNDRTLPTEGSFFRSRFEQDIPGMGADHPLTWLRAQAWHAMSWDPWTLHLGGKGQANLAGTVFLDRALTLGGEGNLSAYPRDWLAGQESVLGAVGLYRQFQGGWRNYFVGGLFEVGRAWQSFWALNDSEWKPSFSVIGGTDTLLGPLRLTLSVGESAETAINLSIGKQWSDVAVFR